LRSCEAKRRFNRRDLEGQEGVKGEEKNIDWAGK